MHISFQGLPIMKFTLTFEGDLKSNGRPADKWAIRKQLAPQLKELWRINPALRRVEQNRIIPKSGFWNVELHHSLEDQQRIRPTDEKETIDLCAPILRGGRRFVPLVRDTFALVCGLKILFLRKEEPGRVYQGGDIDNRLKTLFDALAIPSADQVIEDQDIEEPIYCLLEDDGLITGFAVDTHRLLSRPGVTEHYVQLIVEVDVRVTQARIYNTYFLGD